MDSPHKEPKDWNAVLEIRLSNPAVVPRGLGTTNFFLNPI